MKYLNLNNAQMPALGFGTWQLEGDTCVDATRAAIDIGYRHIDTAQIYGNEVEVGRAIHESGVARSELFVTTKLWTNNLSIARVASSMDESLNKLGMNHVNLLLIHWPSTATPLSETLDAMQELLNAGKTKAIGVSNFPVKWMKEAIEKCKVPIVCNQVEYHAMLSQNAVLDYAKSHNIAITAYSPLARARLAKDPTLAAIGKKYGKSAGQVALRWLIEQEGIAAIPKAATAANAKLNFDIFDFKLDAEDNKQIAKLNNHTRTVNPAGIAPEWDAV